jgi:hypothetical protein
MAGHMSLLNPRFLQQQTFLQSVFQRRFSPEDALARANDKLYQILLQQASYWAFMDLFFLVACVCAISIVFILFYEKPHAVHVVHPGE